MGTEYKDVDVNMEDSGNSCGSSVVSDYSGPSDHTDFDGEGVQISDLEGENDSHSLQVGNFLRFDGTITIFIPYLHHDHHTGPIGNRYGVAHELLRPFRSAVCSLNSDYLTLTRTSFE